MELIFKLFDGQNRGYISAEQIDLDSVPPEVLLVFKPLLIEMETYRERLDKEEFVASGIALLKSASIKDRNTILDCGKKKAKVE